MPSTYSIVVFASGSGSNLQRIYEYFAPKSEVEVVCVFCNNPTAFVIERCKKLNIRVVLFTKEELQNGSVLTQLLQINPDLIVLAGFLWLMPSAIIQSFPRKIINIHPALLPLYGGKGMYGRKVHEAVVQDKKTETGITIHYVNEVYDKGEIILQMSCTVTSHDTADDVAHKVHALEYEYFPKVIAKILGVLPEQKVQE